MQSLLSYLLKCGNMEIWIAIYLVSSRSPFTQKAVDMLLVFNVFQLTWQGKQYCPILLGETRFMVQMYTLFNVWLYQPISP